MTSNPHIGSSLEDFLREEGIYEETNTVAVKRVLAWQIQQLMAEQHLTKTEMATRMQTSRAALERLLDCNNESVTLNTLSKAAQSVGKRLHMELVDA